MFPWQPMYHEDVAFTLQVPWLNFFKDSGRWEFLLRALSLSLEFSFWKNVLWGQPIKDMKKCIYFMKKKNCKNALSPHSACRNELSLPLPNYNSYFSLVRPLVLSYRNENVWKRSVKGYFYERCSKWRKSETEIYRLLADGKNDQTPEVFENDDIKMGFRSPCRPKFVLETRRICVFRRL